MTQRSKLSIEFVEAEFPLADLNDPIWDLASAATVVLYWDASESDAGRHLRVQLLWSDTALYLRFDASQNEPPVVNDHPQLDKKTMQLWERDVCEIFIAPDMHEPRRYFEFEVAPTGEWLDLAIDSTSGDRVTDWDYDSRMETAAKIEKNRVLMAMKIPWETLGRKPKPGDVWLGNIFRCVGKDPDRGYLAWQPTLTEMPDFHVPEKFGEFLFEK